MIPLFSFEPIPIWLPPAPICEPESHYIALLASNMPQQPEY